MRARVGFALAVAGASLLAAPRTTPRPVDAAGAIFDAFRTHAVVGLSDGETHGDEEPYSALRRLYLGPPSTLTVAPLSTTICADSDYVETHLRRMAIAELPPSEPDTLKQLCAR